MEGDVKDATAAYADYISIHALRVEGDEFHNYPIGTLDISIHALRVEGDAYDKAKKAGDMISIHALRVEGDTMIY